MATRAGGSGGGHKVWSMGRGRSLARLTPMLLALLLGQATGPANAAEALPNYDEQAAGLSESLSKAAELYRDKKYDELGKLISGVERKLDELKNGENSERLASALVPLERRLAAATDLLKTAVTEGPANSKKLAGKGAKPSTPVKTAMRTPPVKPMANMPAKPAAMAKNSAAPGMSYARDIGPLLISKCGRCHSNDPKGGFSIISYASLMRGSDTGTVFKPGTGDGSTLIEILKSGDMPRGGGKLADEQIAMLTKWIDAGAPYDGDPAAAMSDGGSSMPTGSETVSFMRDIAPVIVGSCTGCHGGQQGADNLEIETFAQIKRGGRSGDFLSAGNPGDSLLIKMLRGTAKDKTGTRPRMPRRGNPLSEEVIKKFETWIAEGAKFDGGDQNVKLDYLLKVIAANNASHDELAKRRDESAGKTWALGNPGNAPIVVEADDYRIVGDLPPARMKEVTEEIRGIQTKVSAALKVPGEKPMYKGKLTLFLFNKRFEYSEFGQMVERRPLTEDLFGHSHYDVIDGYACVLANEDNKLNVPLLVAEGFASSYVETLARDVPRWYSIGMGRSVASRIEPRSPLLKQWDEQSSAGTPNLQQFLQAKELDSQGSAVAYRIVRNLMGRGSANQKLIDTMRKGSPFQGAFLQAYGMQPAVAAAAALR